VSPDQPSKSVQRAVIDRIVGDSAVLLIGDREEERSVPVADLPEGANEGSHVEVRVSARRVEVLRVDEAGTDEKRAEMKDRLSRLKQTRSTGRFDRSNPRPK
jgi:hypothetical protein